KAQSPLAYSSLIDAYQVRVSSPMSGCSASSTAIRSARRAPSASVKARSFHPANCRIVANKRTVTFTFTSFQLPDTEITEETEKSGELLSTKGIFDAKAQRRKDTKEKQKAKARRLVLWGVPP